MPTNKEYLLQKLIWDYSYSVDELNRLLTGEIDQLGHLTKRMLLVRAMESLSWFSVLELFGAEEVLRLLNDGAGKELRSPALRRRYEFTKSRLQKII